MAKSTVKYNGNLFCLSHGVSGTIEADGGLDVFGSSRQWTVISPLIRWGCFLLLVLSLASCVSTPLRGLPAIPELVDQPQYDIPDVDLLTLSPGMKEFTLRYSESTGRRHGGAWTLVYAVMDRYIFDFDYDPQLTLPADKTFERRTGNCLSFSSMLVAMAREAGMTAYFQEVEIPPTWQNVDDNMLVAKHVNAVIVDDGNSFTVDVSGRVTRGVERTRRLRDAEAKAQFYNNLGVDALIAKDMALAYAYFRKGLEIDRRQEYLWANMAVVLRRNGQTSDAITAYRTVLELEPNDSVALNNLYVIHSEDGNLQAAEEIRGRVERNRQKNPYYIQLLAEEAIEELLYSDAIELARKAISMEANEYRFYYTLARAQYLAGKTDAARDSLDQARQLAPDQKARDSLVPPGET